MRLPAAPNTGNAVLDKYLRHMSQVLEKVPQIYYEKNEYTAAAGEAGKPIKSDERGKIAGSFIVASDIAHDNTSGISGGDPDDYQHLSDQQLNSLTNGGECTLHFHDERYFAEDEFTATSTGTADAGKPVILDAEGNIDASMLNDEDISHNGLDDLQGGTTDQYYHLSLAQYNKLTTAQSAISDPSGGATVDTQARSAINAILDLLAAAGLME